MRSARATGWAAAIARLGSAAAIACVASGCAALRGGGAVSEPPPADPAWTELAARVHAGRTQAVATELDASCGRGSGAACSALADLIQLGLLAPLDRASAGDLYLRACGRGHELACRTLEQGVSWLTLPLLRARHMDSPRLRHAIHAAGPDMLHVDVCVDGRGVPVRVHMRGSTGRNDDDARLARAASQWRFVPLAVGASRSLAACGRFAVRL